MGICFGYQNQINLGNKEICINKPTEDVPNEQIEKNCDFIKKRSLCKIKGKNNNYELGIFCKFNFKYDNKLKYEEIQVLIIYNSSISDNNIDIDKSISFLLNNKSQSINLDKSRKIYKGDNENCLKIIEIKRIDNLEDIHFLDTFEIKNINQLCGNIYYLFYYSKGKIETTSCDIELRDTNNFYIKNNIRPEGSIVFNILDKKIIGIINKDKTGIFCDNAFNKFKSILNEKVTSSSMEERIKPELNNSIFIKPLMICFSKIDTLKKFYSEKYDNNKNENINSLIYKFMINPKDDSIIKKIEEKIETIDKYYLLKDLNIAKFIDFLLTELHKELNRKGDINMESLDGDYDEKMSFKNFQKEYLKHNDSEIQKLFFGFREISICPKNDNKKL